MPLYKRKFYSQLNENKALKSTNSTLKRKTFKTPLQPNEILTDTPDINNIEKLSRNITNIEKPALKKSFRKTSSIELRLSFEEIFDKCDTLKNADNKENLNKEAKKQTSKNVKNRIHEIHTNNKSKLDIKKKGNKVISQIFKDGKENFIEQEKEQNKNVEIINETGSKRKNVSNKHVKTAKKKKNEEKKKNSELEDSIISLWSQQEIPSNEPPKHLTHYERLLWLQENRNIGLHVQCDRCDKFRYLKDTVDPLDLPEHWYCRMNPDKSYNKCSDPEEEISAWKEEHLIYNLYHAGSIVWAKLDGYPWWPAIIDDCPNTEMYYWLDDVYSNIPSYYHVTFFDSKEVTRAWLRPKAIHKFKDNIDNPKFQLSKYQIIFKKRLEHAKAQAENALNLNILSRLRQYSFIARWSGTINTPQDTTEEGKTQINKRRCKRHYKKVNKETKMSGNSKESKKFSKKSFVKSPISKDLNGELNQNSADINNNNKYLSPDIFEDNVNFIDEIVKSISSAELQNEFDDL